MAAFFRAVTLRGDAPSDRDIEMSDVLAWLLRDGAVPAPDVSAVLVTSEALTLGAEEA